VVAGAVQCSVQSQRKEAAVKQSMASWQRHGGFLIEGAGNARLP